MKNLKIWVASLWTIFFFRFLGKHLFIGYVFIQVAGYEKSTNFAKKTRKIIVNHDEPIKVFQMYLSIYWIDLCLPGRLLSCKLCDRINKNVRPQRRQQMYHIWNWIILKGHFTRLLLSSSNISYFSEKVEAGRYMEW